MSEVITIGEPLVVFCSTEPDISLKEAVNFKRVVGGAELNVAIGLNRLGHTVKYISQIGRDPQGDFIEDQINKQKLDSSVLKKTSLFITGYQMKQLVTEGDPKVFNFRKSSAASHMTPDILKRVDLTNAKFGHLTGIFPALSDSSLETSIFFAKQMNKRKITLTFDPNLRPRLWKNETYMVKTINKLAKYADIMLPGIKEGKILTGLDSPQDIADYYLQNPQTKAVFVKLGPDGAYVKTKTNDERVVQGFKVAKVVDTVGAGDGFALGVISALLEGKSYFEAANRGNAIGALQVQTHGDNDGYPNRGELGKFYEKNSEHYE